MVREWVLERLQFERTSSGQQQESISAKRVLEMQADLVALTQRVNALESKRK